MDTFIRDLNPSLTTIIQIMQTISILLTKGRTQPEDEAEGEEGEKGIEEQMGVSVVQIPHGNGDPVAAENL